MTAIYTWNINSIRNKMSRINEVLEKYNIDILLVTETKIMKMHEYDCTVKLHEDYNVVWNSNKASSWHGTAFIYKKEWNCEVLATTLPYSQSYTEMKDGKNKKIIEASSDESVEETKKKAHLSEGRLLTCKFSLEKVSDNLPKEVVLCGTYSPNSGVDRKNPLQRLRYRVEVWDSDLSAYLSKLRNEYTNVIWLGDFNVCSKYNDMRCVLSGSLEEREKKTQKMNNIAGTTPEERYNFNKFMESGEWIDTWDVLNPTVIDPSLRRTHQWNLRLDYIVCSNRIKGLVNSTIHHSEGGSDHFPLGTIFNLE